MKCYRRLINIQHTKVSGLCGANRFTQVYRALYGDAMQHGTDQYVDQKSAKTSGFHLCDKSYFFLLVSKLVFAKTRFVPLKSRNCWKSLAFLKPDISAEITTVVPSAPGTVKIWKFKMLYFPNGTRFSAWYSKEFLAILILEFDDVTVKALSCLLRIRLRAVSYFSLQSYCTRKTSTRPAKPRTAINKGVVWSQYNVVVCNLAGWDKNCRLVFVP